MKRIETDSLGPIEVDTEAYWGAQTQRSLTYFSSGREVMPLAVIYALSLIKKAAARVNQRNGNLSPALSQLIEQVADEILAGQHDAQFPLRVWQTGSGTQSNMNVNDVIAGRANELAGDLARAGEAYAEAAFLNGPAEQALIQLQNTKRPEDLDYYARARVDARIAAITPQVLELRRQGIRDPDVDRR